MRKFVEGDKGLTLVEVLASTIIITLILSTFLMMFAQAAKTNSSSETIIDSTYTAQAEMEQLYALSKKTAPTGRLAALTNKYGSSSPKTMGGIKWIQFNRVVPETDKKINIRLEDASAKNTRIIIEVYEGTKTNPSAKMENVLVWEVVSP